MKQKDIVVLVIIAFFAMIFSALLSGKIFNSSKNHSLKVPVVQTISSDFPRVSSEERYKDIFNSNALDPTQLIRIGTGQNTTPFNGGQ